MLVFVLQVYTILIIKNKKNCFFTHFGTTESKNLFFTAVFDPDGIHNTNGVIIDIFWNSSSITVFQRYEELQHKNNCFASLLHTFNIKLPFEHSPQCAQQFPLETDELILLQGWTPYSNVSRLRSKLDDSVELCILT